ncbi:hypothetical protein CYLTODRAFT_418210 [Cylindrobasidium torrendii FP15055 ss-10]|uniref:F-box domain-containing protein n=1 Tax=Cylindrobasidium torrendii FP15055 ss-10 TaxID=1314674 RepID=A0A0D7BQZ3_9AGAR|nr:hypothetical protein CYLTODRAFT_418210 [Cylindrobasidium torrendii FP15055 ss-10]
MTQASNSLAMLRAGETLDGALMFSFKRRLTELEATMNALLREIGLQRALLAPIRRLPREILLGVFELMDDTVDTETGRAVLGQVCRFWRTLSRSCPSLWTKVDIMTFLPESANFAEQTLLLSGDLDIHIKVYLSRLRDETKATRNRAWKMVGTHSRRAAVLEVNVVNGKIPSLERFQFRRISTLRLVVAGSIHNPEDVQGRAMVILPGSLRNLSLCGTYPTRMTVDWSTLTTLDINFPTSFSCYQILSQCKNISSLQINHIGSLDGGVLHDNGNMPTVLHNIQHLTISACACAAFPISIDLPRIVKLTLVEPFCTDGRDVQHASANLQSILCRSKASVRILECHWSPDDAYVILQHCGLSIDTLDLHIYALDGVVEPAFERLFQSLTLPSTTILLPSLTTITLSLELGHQYEFMGTSFSAAVESRRTVEQEGVRRLERVELACARTSRSLQVELAMSPLSLLLLRLEQGGLQASWDVGSGYADILDLGRRRLQMLQ